MRNLLSALVFMLSFLTLSAQKQVNDPNVETRNVSGFHGVDVSSGIELILTQGNSEAVAISSADGKYNQDIITEVKNGILKIGIDMSKFKNWKSYNKKLKAYVSIKNIDKVEASSGAHVKVEGSIKSDKILLDASSGAIVEGSFQASTMEVDQSSGSIVRVSGEVKDLNVDGSSGSIFEGYDLSAGNCVAETSSGSMVRVTVNKELSVHASSGGSINYKGSAVIRNIKTGSGGHVSRKS